MSEHFWESTIKASNTSKSVFFTWMMLLTVPSWLVTTGWEETGYKSQNKKACRTIRILKTMQSALTKKKYFAFKIGWYQIRSSLVLSVGLRARCRT